MEILKLGNTVLHNIEICTHVFPDECFSDGVLGMNVLELFNFRVDLTQKIVELETR